jgi:hypothetical protein
MKICGIPEGSAALTLPGPGSIPLPAPETAVASAFETRPKGTDPAGESSLMGVRRATLAPGSATGWRVPACGLDYSVIDPITPYRTKSGRELPVISSSTEPRTTVNSGPGRGPWRQP